MGQTFSRIWSMSRIIQATPYLTTQTENSGRPLGLHNDGFRYGLFAVGAPLIAVWVTFWVFTDLPYFLPDAPVRIGFYRDLGSQGIAYGVGILFGGIIGIPLMLVLIMPYCARLVDMGELRFRYYVIPAIIIGPIFAFIIFPVFFGLRDGLGFVMPTLVAFFLTMVLVYMGYVLGDPKVTVEILMKSGKAGNQVTNALERRSIAEKAEAIDSRNERP